MACLMIECYQNNNGAATDGDQNLLILHNNMENKNIKESLPSISTRKIIDTTSYDNIQSSLLSANELSNGLRLAMPDNAYLTFYEDALESQKEILKSASLLKENLNFNVDNYIAPLSGSIAELGLVGANSKKLFESGIIDKAQLVVTQQFSGFCLDSIKEQQQVLTSAFKNIENSGALSELSSIAVKSAQIINSGVDNMVRSFPTYPTEITLPNLEVLQGVVGITEEEISEHQQELDEILSNIDPHLVTYRIGCWNTFSAKRDDYIGQSTSSMRRLVDDLLRNLAPTEKVEETSSFKASLKEKEEGRRPTRRDRICYAVDFDTKKTKHLERLIKGFLEIYNNLSAWDHEPLQRDVFVRGTFIAIEGYLISLLSEIKK